MAKDFLYCEINDTKIYPNDVVAITTYPESKFIAKQGWYKLGTARKHGWYFVNLSDKSVIPLDLIDIEQVIRDPDQQSSAATKPTIDTTQPKTTDEPVKYFEVNDTKIYINDMVSISDYPKMKFVAKFGWYNYDGKKQNGWYFLSVEDKAIIPKDTIKSDSISKEIIIGTSELRPTLKDMDTPTPEVKYLVIPDTNIRLYDGDIIKISNKPRVKWIVHAGWFIYQEVQNFGWYFECIKNGEILPATIIDLKLCTLVTTKTQGSVAYDGKVVNYTRPFTVADAELLNRTFITLDTIEQRDNIDPTKLVDGKMVRVNDVGGIPVYYAWNSKLQLWEKIETQGGEGIPEIIGTPERPIILADLEPGLYRVKGTYKISTTYPAIIMTPIDHIAFVSNDDDVNIKVITDTDITDYIVVGDTVTFVDEYATHKYIKDNYADKVYVDTKIAVVESEISRIISEFHDKVVEIVYEVLNTALDRVSEDYINNLFE